MRGLIFLAGIALATPAFAQSDNKGDDQKDSITIGGGVATTPRFEGSGDNHIIPAAQARGSISGISFTTQGTGLYVDLIPRETPTGGKLVLGPVIHGTFNRTSLKTINDIQIERLGKLDTGIEVGGQIGYSQNGVITSDYDNLSLTVAGYYDVGGASKSYVITPQISYGTPLSKTIYVGLSAAAHYVGGKYSQYYFGVTAPQSVASGLAAYSIGSGFKDVTFGAIAALSLSGDLRKGVALFGGVSQTQFLGKFKRSPITRDNSNLTAAVGIGITF
ncbi:MipA/OmpV family protein [Sphingomonas antarctica]|uniref:MipA/OmpV family protein n=1 Tax=Sphingomonas antarctica TaxID=2040274 RepID=UPI0039EA33AC